MFGKLKDYQREGNKVVFIFEKREGIIEVVTPSIVNVFAQLAETKHPSHAIENLKVVKNHFSVQKDNKGVIISTTNLIIRVSDNFKVDFFNAEGLPLCQDYRGERKPFPRRGQSEILEAEGHTLTRNVSNQKVEVLKKLEGDEYFYGLGEKTGHLNKKGYRYQMWNTDDPSPHVESFETLYKSIPFLITLQKNIAYGLFFDNTYRSYFDLGKENQEYFYYGAEGGNLNYYFISGPTVKDVIENYTYLTGRTPLPQLWVLGYQQSRYSYVPEERVREIASHFREKEIPCDVIHLDIDYMDGYRVFTWDKEKFPNFKKMISDLFQQGFKVVTIIDPGLKKDINYTLYKEGLKNGYLITDQDGIPYVNVVWPGETVFPDFSDQKVRQWWGNNHKILTDIGISGIWNDMNEPAGFKENFPDDLQFKNDGYPTDHREMHNVYGHLMSKASYQGMKKLTNKRPFIITRACYAGTQKYSTVWTGDNQSFWEHLRMAIPMLINLGLSGIPFCGTDVGGFGFDCTGELLARWMQLGCFTPLFRNHSATMTRDQEPWAFDEEVEEISRKYIRLRYKLIPYLYDLMYQTSQTGLPVIRPLFLHYQDDQNTYQINDQFLFGEHILVAPVVQQGQSARTVYLPQGKWIDFWTSEIIEGPQYITRKTPLETCPIYIKAGSIIPNYPVQNYIGEVLIDTLLLDIYPGKGDYLHYQDDGESFNYQKGEYNLYHFRVKEDQNRIRITTECINNGYQKSYKSLKLKVNNLKAREVIVDNHSVSFKNDENILLFEVSAKQKHLIDIITK